MECIWKAFILLAMLACSIAMANSKNVGVQSTYQDQHGRKIVAIVGLGPEFRGSSYFLCVAQECQQLKASAVKRVQNGDLETEFFDSKMSSKLAINPERKRFVLKCDAREVAIEPMDGHARNALVREIMEGKLKLKPLPDTRVTEYLLKANRRDPDFFHVDVPANGNLKSYRVYRGTPGKMVDL